MLVEAQVTINGSRAAIWAAITNIDAAENEFYKTRAEDGGFVFVSTMRISERSGGNDVDECA